VEYKKVDIEELPETIHFLVSDEDTIEEVVIDNYIEGQIVWNAQSGQSHIKYFNCPDYEKRLLKDLKGRWELVVLGNGIERKVKDMAKEIGGTEPFQDFIIL